MWRDNPPIDETLNVKAETHSRTRQLIRFALSVLLIATPVLLSVVLLQAAWGVWLTDAFPFWSDEIWYWHQAQAFATAGFESGYYTIKEVPAPAEMSPFISWGMFVSIFQGIVAAIFDWQLNTLMLFNLATLTAALALLVWVLRPTIEQCLMLIAFLAMFSPLWLYSFTTMFVVFELGVGAGLAVGFIVLLRREQPTSRWVWISIVVVLVVASFLRLMWAVFFLPLIVLTAPQIKLSRFVLGIISTALLGLFFAWATIQTGAPYPSALTSQIVANLGSDPAQALALMVEHVTNNLNLLDDGESYEVLYRQQLAVWTVMLFGLAGFFAWRKRETARSELIAIGLILYAWGSYWVLGLLLNDTRLSRDFRLMVPVMLFGVLIMVMHRWRGAVLVVLVSVALALPATWDVYKIWSNWHVDADMRNAYYAWGAEFEKLIPYEPDAPNRWCNTLLHSHLYMWTQTTTVLSVPDGIGLSTTFEQADMPPPYKSRWVMMTDEEFAQWADNLNFTVLMRVPFGALYRNNESACPE